MEQVLYANRWFRLDLGSMNTRPRVPDHTWRRRATIALMMTGLLASMALNGVIGLPDAFRALTFAQRITGALFVLSAVVLGAASFAVLDYWGGRQFKISGAVVLLGVLIALATDSLLVFMWLEEREYTHYLLAFAPLLLWSVWALLLLIRSRIWKEVPKPKQFAAGVIATALLTAISLAYSTMYQPVSAPMHLKVKAKFGKPWKERDGPLLQIPLKLYMKNTGSIPVYIVNDDCTVSGRSVEYSAAGDMMNYWSMGVEPYGDVDAEAYAVPAEQVTVSSGHFHGPGKTLSPGEEYAAEKLIHLPERVKYDLIEVELIVVYARKDRGEIDLNEFLRPRFSWGKEEGGKYYCPPDECGNFIVHHGSVRHNNNVINVTRRPRFVTAYWSPELPPLFTIASSDYKKLDNLDKVNLEELEKERERELERYGVNTVVANSVVSVAKLIESLDG